MKSIDICVNGAYFKEITDALPPNITEFLGWEGHSIWFRVNAPLNNLKKLLEPTSLISIWFKESSAYDPLKVLYLKKITIQFNDGIIHQFEIMDVINKPTKIITGLSDKRANSFRYEKHIYRGLCITHDLDEDKIVLSAKRTANRGIDIDYFNCHTNLHFIT